MSVKEEIKMRYSKDEIMEHMKQLYLFSQDESYQNDLKVLINYLEDVTKVMIRYREIAEESSKALDDLMKQVESMMPLADKKRGG